MEFEFNLNEIFINDISEVNHTLLPSDFSGDGSKAQHLASQVAVMIDEMGLESAKSQGLHHPVISAEKMKNCNDSLYVMIDPTDNNGKGSVVGVLKVGMKNLFMFDGTGKCHESKSLCVLDFYIHEKKRRSGMGKKLFDFMLQDKGVEPCKLAFDKPSQDFVSFLHKHYGLAKIYPQNNNFVMFEGFFEEKDKFSSLGLIDVHSALHQTETNSQKQDREDRRAIKSTSDRHEREDYLPNLYGRHTAYKLKDTMGSLIGDGSGSSH